MVKNKSDEGLRPLKYTNTGAVDDGDHSKPVTIIIYTNTYKSRIERGGAQEGYALPSLTLVSWIKHTEYGPIRRKQKEIY